MVPNKILPTEQNTPNGSWEMTQIQSTTRSFLRFLRLRRNDSRDHEVYTIDDVGLRAIKNAKLWSVAAEEFEV
jgi:hypothetical protein